MSHGALPPELEPFRAVSEREVTAILGVSLQTARNWRSLRRGPPYLKLGRAVRYPLAELLEWRDAHRIAPEGRRPDHPYESKDRGPINRGSAG